MKKKKVLITLISLALIMAITIPGTLAISSAQDDTAAPAECTCGNVEHSEDCPLYTAPTTELSLYERLMATETVEAFESVLNSATEQEYFGLTEEEYAAAEEHYMDMGGFFENTPLPDNSYAPATLNVDDTEQTVNFTKVAPLVGV